MTEEGGEKLEEELASLQGRRVSKVNERMALIHATENRLSTGKRSLSGPEKGGRAVESVQQGRPRCFNCGLEIAWEPIVVEGKVYCCGGCALGGPCYCSYDPPQIAVSLPAPKAGRGAEENQPGISGSRRGR